MRMCAIAGSVEAFQLDTEVLRRGARAGDACGQQQYRECETCQF
jgi:hypothetical protein